jgi:CDP-2,3-bis-(O-geranylgeranyl)-sn-glycerol synthase
MRRQAENLTLEMTLTFNDVLSALYFMIPAYVANSTPTIFGGGKAIDLGRRFIDGEPIFGANKTIRGFIGGLALGSSVGIVEALVFSQGLLPKSVLTSLGSLSGDLAGAFIKRRMKLSPGFPLPLMDQLDFILGALLFSCPIYGLNMNVIFILLLITPPLHLATNSIAYALKLKNTAW